MDTTPYWMASGPLPQFDSIQKDIEVDVAIVGAGPVGLTTALGLAYYNIPFVLFEAKAHTHFDRDGMRTSI